MRFAAIALVVFTACSPLAPFVPPDLPRGKPLAVPSNAAWPKSEVQVFLDELGIPHIYGKSEPDLAYALGLMHGRDRAFQIYLYVHAGEGRLSEILGDEVLDLDKENRLLMVNADEQIAATEPRDKEMINAYCAGVNAGAAMVGRSAEMALLGVDWEPLTPRDVLAVVRLQQWDQSVGFSEEMARHRLMSLPVASELMPDAPSGGVPIVSADEDEARPAPATTSLEIPPGATPSLLSSTTPSAARNGAALSPLTAASTDDARAPLASTREDLVASMRELFDRGGTGASNSWSVAGSHTESGVAVLANDPHLAHMAPGVFYMADMHLPGAVVAGGTFPGIPAVLIGHGAHIAWGVTNAYADTQDVVILDAHGDTYRVDGADVPFGKVVQRFKLGRSDDAKVIEETWRTSIFGPVLPEGYPGVKKGEALALLWSAQQFPQENSRLVSAFWDLAKSKNVDDATRAVQDFASPAMSVNMAFTDGTIAYRLSGIIPARADDERADRPRDGSKKSAGWTGRIAADAKPHETSPKKGYIVASNQRVVENGVGAQAAVGFEAARPFRAMRITARIHALIDDGRKAATDDLLAIQQDITSIDAQELAPIFGAHCPKHVEGHPDAQVASFCAAVANFDGVYKTDAVALPFARVEDNFARIALKDATGDDALADALYHQTFATIALEDIAVKEHAGARSLTLQKRGLDGTVALAVKQALDDTVADAGPTPADWRWGKLHRLGLRGALAVIPVVGGFFTTTPHEESGFTTTPRAEHPDFSHHLRVVEGAGLRLIAEMTDPPTVRMVSDSGNSGHFGSKHLDDQYPLWHRGKPRVLTLDAKDAEALHQGALVILPRPAAPAG